MLASSLYNANCFIYSFQFLINNKKLFVKYLGITDYLP